MSVARVLQAPLKCQRCHYAALNAFVGLAGISLPSTSRRPKINLIAEPNRSTKSYGRRTFSCSVAKARPNPPANDASIEDQETLGVPGASAQESVPWYLQVQETVEPEATLLESQRLPDTPEDSPTLVRDVVTHLSEGVGMEYISLLDLRSLDPPPALGSNLIMIVATARSVRHLNVSADRFCRWLRTNYNLNPDADGLLGRRELKLKLRRKARRAKILGSKTRSTDSDDGITTGWVCVNIGAIEQTEKKEQEVRGEFGDVTGFGQEAGGIHLVVQLMTEDKRESLQLEDLWLNYLRRQQRRIEARYKGLAEVEDTAEADEASLKTISQGAAEPSSDKATSLDPTAPQYPSSGSPASSNHPALSQIRGFHTSARRPAGLSVHHVPTSIPRDALSENTRQAIPATALNERLQYLTSLSPDEARAALGEGWRDRSSTPFLTSFFSEFGLFPSIDEYRTWLELMQHGKAVQNPGYTVVGMLHLLREMQESHIAVPEAIFNTVLSHIAQSDDPAVLVDSLSANTDAEPLSTVISLLEDLHLRSHSIRTQPVLDALFRAIAHMQQRSPHAASASLHPQPTAQLAQLAHDYKCHVPSLDTHLTAVDELAAAQRFDALWKIWEGFPIRQEPRPAVLYTAVFRGVARAQHQRACVDAITRLTATMSIEDPPVKAQGELAVAMMECLQVADPRVPEQWRTGGHASKPYVRLFQACVDGLGREGVHELDDL